MVFNNLCMVEKLFLRGIMLLKLQRNPLEIHQEREVYTLKWLHANFLVIMVVSNF